MRFFASITHLSSCALWPQFASADSAILDLQKQFAPDGIRMQLLQVNSLQLINSDLELDLDGADSDFDRF